MQSADAARLQHRREVQLDVDNAGQLKITDYTDTLGICFARDRYKYDSNGDGMLTAADLSVPACGTLPRRVPGDTIKFNDAADFFCQKLENTVSVAARASAGSTIFVGETGLESVHVLRDGPTPLVRHVFTNH